MKQRKKKLKIKGPFVIIWQKLGMKRERDSRNKRIKLKWQKKKCVLGSRKTKKGR